MTELSFDGKLVRDGTPDIIREHGGDPVGSVLNEDAYRTPLGAKLIEEVQELLTATSAEETVKELADVLGVLMAIASVSEVEWAHVE